MNIRPEPNPIKILTCSKKKDFNSGLSTIFATMLQEAILSSTPSQNQPMVSDMESDSGSRFFSDYLGLSGSLLCLIHCLAPQLLFLGSVSFGLASFFSSGWWHLLFWASCLVAVWQTSKITPIVGFRFVLWGSFGLFTIGTALDFFMGIENLIAYLGSGLLVAGHSWNLFRLAKKSKISPAQS